MTTSGSTDFSLTARELFTDVMEDLGAIALSVTPPAEEMEKVRRAYNLMVKTWGTVEKLWIQAEGSVTLTASTASYTASPVSLARRINGVWRRTSNIDTPLTKLSRQEYLDEPAKTAAGYPRAWYFDPQRTTRTLTVVGVPDATIAASTTLRIDYDRVLEDVDDLDNDLDLPQEWLETAKECLKARLLDAFSVRLTDPAKAAGIEQRAGELYAQLSTDSQEDGSVFFSPA